jgi:hypothetical protein
MGVVATSIESTVQSLEREALEMADIGTGDLLEAGFANGKIVIPKSRVDRHLAEGLRDARRGKTHGPYATAAAAIRALERRARRLAKQRRSSEH